MVLILASLIGYLEWGKQMHTILFNVEVDLLVKLFTHPKSVIHPFTLLPLIGQILLFISVFKQKPNKTLNRLGIIFIASLYLFVLFVGLLAHNLKIVVSTLPFLVIAAYTIKYLWHLKLD
jgi:hypothetical protein